MAFLISKVFKSTQQNEGEVLTAAIVSPRDPCSYRNVARKRRILASAAAAGIAVAFGSPLGGVLFGLEGASHLTVLHHVCNEIL